MNKTLLIAILNRLKQPSSYAGLSALLVILHMNVDPGFLQYVVDICTGLSGIAAVILNEKSVPPQDTVK